MESERVTIQLVVAADGALTTLDRFDKEMVTAANASLKAGAAADAFTLQVERMRKAQETGLPVLKARAAAIQAEERVLQNALGRAEPIIRAQIAAERELGRVVAASSNLVVQGKLAEEQAIQQVTAIERAHVNQINKVIAAQRMAADAAQSTAMSVNNNAAALQNFNTSASRNAAESANIAMQFQDIAVSAQMGMSPMMIALQQGTQLSAIFNQMRNPLQALPAAFMQIINPVSLVTIGFVALAAAAGQWLFEAFKGAETAEDALKAHNEWLDKLLVGYDDLREAAGRAAEAAQKLPSDAVNYEMDQAAEEARKRYQESLKEIARIQATVNEQTNLFRIARDEAARSMTPGNGAFYDSMIELNNQMTSLAVNADTSIGQLNQFDVALRRLRDSSSDAGVRQVAEQMLALIENARTAAAQVKSLGLSLEDIERHKRIQIEIEVDTERAKAAIDELKRLAPELRSPRERAADALSQARGSQDAVLRMAAEQQYATTIAAIDEQERRKEAERASRKGKESNPFETATENMAQQIAMLEAQAKAFGLTDFEANKLLATQELLNAANEAGMAITPEVQAQISGLATAYSEAQLALAGLQINMENRSPWQVMQEEIVKLNELMDRGLITSDAYNASLGKLAESMVSQYASAATGVLGQVQKLTDGMAEQEKNRILASGLANDEMAAALEDHARRQFEINKQIAMANAVVAGGEAIVKSYNWGTTLGGPLGGGIAAGIAAAATAAQIAAIASSSYQSKSLPGGGAAGGGAAAAAPATKQVAAYITLYGDSFSGSQVTDLARELAEQVNTGGANELVVAINNKARRY